MIKKTIKYKDFNDQEREETFYFHLSKADLIQMEAQQKGGLKFYLERIQQEQDIEKIWGFLTQIVLTAYGKRSEDGARHIKNAQYREEFQSSEAFSELLMELLGDPSKAAEFVNGIIPHDLADQIAQIERKTPPPGPRPEVATANVFEKESAPRPMDSPVDRDEPFVPTESMKHPPREAMSDTPEARVLTAVEIREMDSAELQRGLVEGRYKLS